MILKFCVVLVFLVELTVSHGDELENTESKQENPADFKLFVPANLINFYQSPSQILVNSKQKASTSVTFESFDEKLSPDFVTQNTFLNKESETLLIDSQSRSDLKPTRIEISRADGIEDDTTPEITTESFSTQSDDASDTSPMTSEGVETSDDSTITEPSTTITQEPSEYFKRFNLFNLIKRHCANFSQISIESSSGTFIHQYAK